MPNRPHRRPSRSAHRVALPAEPMLRQSAVAAGWSPAAQRHAVQRGDLERFQRAVLAGRRYVAVESWARARELALTRARAAALTCPRAAVSHLPAAVEWSLPTLGDPLRPCLTVPAGTALRRLAHVHLHRATLLDTDVVQRDGYCVTSPARTVTDIAREHGVPAGIIAADHALHGNVVSRDELAASAEQCRGWPGRRSARVVAGFADGLAESPLESLSRLAMAARDLPRPQLQPWLCDEFGRIIGRPDFYWDEFGVVGECDGELKYAGNDAAVAIGKEKSRHTDFEQAGLIVVRWGWPDLRTFDDVAKRLRTSCGRGAPPGSRDRRWGVLALHP